MPIPFRDEISFLFNGGRGLRTDQLNGEFVKTVIVEGDTLVVTKQMADGSEEQVRAEGVMGVPTFLRRAGTSVDATFTAAEMIAGTTSMNESIVTPPQVAGTVDQQYLGFWLPDTADELTNITYVETTSINRRYQWFGQPVALAVDGADGYVYPSVASFNLPVPVIRNGHCGLNPGSSFRATFGGCNGRRTDIYCSESWHFFYRPVWLCAAGRNK